MMTLGAYLTQAASEPWEWGWSDCSTHVADWVLGQTGIDPMAEWRGCYSSAAEAGELIDEAGGLEALFARGLDPIWNRRDEPREGAVGVVSLPGEGGEPIDVGAVHTGRRWSLKSPRGLACITEPLAVRAIWAR